MISRAEFFKLIVAALIGQKHFPALLKWWRARLAPPVPITTWDPVLISLVRRSMPNLLAMDICNVQPMTGPTGLIFAMRSKYASDGKAPVQTGPQPNLTHPTMTCMPSRKPPFWIPDYQRYSDQIG